jgi:spore coat polysaccharide biosynthesis protein SpsF (cytidylyltransferase family)
MAIQQDLEHTTSHLYRVAFDEITPIIDSINFDAISLTVDTKEDFERVNGLIIERDLSLSSSWRLAL